MRGLVAEDGRALLRDDLPRPEPAPGEVRVRVERAGVCATDLALVAGYMDYAGVLGHEFVGVAQEGRYAGQRVVGEINAACGRCAACEAGWERHCPQRSVLGILGRPGAFAEELSLPEGNLHPVAAGISPEAATFAEPLAAAFEIGEQLPLQPGERALVLGDGRLGLLCAQVLARAGLSVEVLGRHPERAARLGANGVPAARALRWLEGAPSPAPAYDLVVEATGDPACLAQAFAWTRPRGTVVLKTTSARTEGIDMSPVVIHELKLLGSRCGPFAPALSALERGEVEVQALIDDRFPLEQGERALARAAEPGVLKVLIEVDP